MTDYTKVREYAKYMNKAIETDDAWAVEYWANAIASDLARQESSRLQTEARALLDRIAAADEARR